MENLNLRILGAWRFCPPMMVNACAEAQCWDLSGPLTLAKSLFCLPVWPGPGSPGLCPQSRNELLNCKKARGGQTTQECR